MTNELGLHRLRRDAKEQCRANHFANHILCAICKRFSEIQTRMAECLDGMLVRIESVSRGDGKSNFPAEHLAVGDEDLILRAVGMVGCTGISRGILRP